MEKSEPEKKTKSGPRKVQVDDATPAPVQAMFTDEQVTALAGALALLGDVIRGEFAYIRAEIGTLRKEIVRRLDELNTAK